MASNSGIRGTSVNSVMVSTPFLGGLNTELAGLVDSTDFTKEELNMTIRADGSRSRRPGVDYEENFTFNNELIDTANQTLAVNCIEWTDINSPDESQTYLQVPYIVVQIGYQIIFYKNEGQPYSNKEIDYKVDLRDYKLEGKTDSEVASERCKFVTAYGCLFITSKAIRPIRLRSAQNETEPYIEVVYPYCTVSCAAFQGKHQRMGSTSDYWNDPASYDFYLDDLLIGHFTVPLNGQYYVPFPNSYTMADSFNSISPEIRRNIVATPLESAPYTWSQYNYGWPSWSPADWITFNASSVNERGIKIRIRVYGWAYKKGRWHPHENWYEARMAGGSSNYTNSTGLSLQIRDTSRGANDRINTDENPPMMSYAHLYNLLNQGWTIELIAQFYKESDSLVRFFPGNNLAQQYLKDKKTDAFKPQDLINMTFGNTPAARGHFKLNFFNQDRLSTGNIVANMQILLGRLQALVDPSMTLDSIRDKLGYTGTEAEIASAQIPTIKPRKDYVADICAYAGRIFYLCGDVLLYSQMISEDISKAAQCYTEADPTSEEMSDVVETDGGLISLPDIGDGVKLATYGDYLFVFGTKGGAVITGTANNIFTATAYSAGSLGSIPTQAPDSFVNTEIGLFYWGTTGIIMLGQGQGGLASQDLSTDRILLWYSKLTNIQHNWCKGIYSKAKKKIYWFYPSDEAKPRRLDMCLVYDLTRGSFAPQQIASGYIDEDSGDYVEADLPEVVSGLDLKVPFKSIKEYPIITDPEGDEPSLEIEVGGVFSDYGNFWAYAQSAYNTENINNVRVRVTTYPQDVSTGAILRCKLENMSGIPLGSSKDILVLKDDYDFSAVTTVTLHHNSDGTFSVQYTGGSLEGTYQASDTIWFGIANDWRDVQNAYTYYGYVAESTLGGSGYTAQTLPDSAIPYFKQKYSLGYTGSSVWCDINKVMLDQVDEGFSFCSINNSTAVFTRKEGTIPSSGAEEFYIKAYTNDVYRNNDGTMEQYGVIRRKYKSTVPGWSSEYLDFVNGKMNYQVFSYNNVEYYSSGVGVTPLPPVFVMINGVLELFGFAVSTQSLSSITIQPLDNSSQITASFTRWLDDADNIFVIERDLSNDAYSRYLLPDAYTKVLADNPIDTEEFTYESSILVCLDVANQKITFGDFRNNLLKDWTAGDWSGDGYNYNSYLISHPMNATQISTFNAKRLNDYVHMKNMPYLITYFKRTETGYTMSGDYIYPSGCFGSVLWDWRTTDRYGKWSSPSPIYKIKENLRGKLYKPYKKTLFDQGYTINKTNIRGLGRAYQIKLESDENKQFILEGIVYDLKSDGRI